MKKAVFLLALSTVALTGCPKHEVIPAPVAKVELDGHMIGTINGGGIEFTEGVAGFEVGVGSVKTVRTSPVLSSAVYYAGMATTESSVLVRISLGSVLWDAANSTDPSITQFNSFFTDVMNQTPIYALAGEGGFEVVYRDGNNKTWTSKASDPGNQAVFTNIVQESDANGDYSKFKCVFSCNVFRMEQVNPLPAPMTEISIPIQNIEFDGWFKR